MNQFDELLAELPKDGECQDNADDEEDANVATEQPDRVALRAFQWSGEQEYRGNSSNTCKHSGKHLRYDLLPKVVKTVEQFDVASKDVIFSYGLVEIQFVLVDIDW